MGCGSSSAANAQQPHKAAGQGANGAGKAAGNGNASAVAPAPVANNGAAADALPTSIKQYKVDRTLGEGASCKVILAVEKNNNKPYAIKIITKHARDRKDKETMFKQEVMILSRLSHPNIVPFVTSFQDEDNWYMVSKMCQGGELFDRVTQGSFTEKAAAELTVQMLRGVQYCHEQRVVHRDIKPENFVFETKATDSNMKLIDFGCALEGADDLYVADVAGSPYYVAPEVLDANYRRTIATWKASDVWSVGVVLFLLVHGYPPFNGSTQDQIFRRIAAGKFAFNKSIPLSAELRDLITKMLTMDPKKRISAHAALQHPWIFKASDTLIPDAVVKGLTDFRQQCRLKKAVARVLANRMTDNDREELKELFKQFDLNGDGVLGPDEIAQMMKKLGRNEVDAKQFLQEYDTDGDGTINLNEMAEAHAMGRLNSDADAKTVFQLFDKDNDGFITPQEIERMCNFLTPEATKELIAEVDRDGDGRITFDEWTRAMHGEALQRVTHQKTNIS